MQTLRYAAVVLILVGAGTAFAETLADVEKKVDELTAQVDAFAYDMKMTTSMKTPQMSMKSESAGKACGRRDGDIWLMRTETNTKTEMQIGENTTKQQSKTVGVCDGKHYYSCTEANGQTMVAKMNIPAESQQFGDKFFDSLRESNTLKLLADDSVDGRKTWVVEATPNGASANGPARTLYYLDQKTGLTIQMLNYDADGDEMTRMVISNIKLDPQLDKARFTFEPPPGVTVMDMTQQGEAGASAQQPQAEQQTQPQEEAPQEEQKEEKKGVGGIKLPF